MAALPKMIYGGTKIGTVMYNEKEVHTIIEQQSNGTNIAVYHKHWGNKNTGGGCYTKRVTHKHTGNSSEGSGCYTKPVYHEHTDSCYKLIKERRTGTLKYSGPVDNSPGYSWYMCTTCNTMVQEHSTVEIYGEHVCNENEYEQNPSCGKTEDAIDHYDLGCGKEEGSIEYKLNCGFDLK